ncbi:H-2 class I histocompatibility antigen, Q9 alpha chain-like [Colossoma macropomum]|uniref:H-2 class I histocompatibility antigen, Q9 alpha chain-like n=1 Tax=Colossoma macropomum TaxID=42526 RepID=UPI0018648C90|nr:H-2 class I histocompatibility antigen, Q9 alpha chain-like [Colossoma macropomum]
MKSLLFLTLSVHLAAAASHSLQYFYTAVTPGINFPEFTVVGLVDGEQIVYYDSNFREMITKTEWMNMRMSNDDYWDYWDSETQISQHHEKNFRTSVDNLMQRFNQSEGVHTVQWMYGCELDVDGTKKGSYMQYGYDGEDFISLDLNTLTWTAANAKAVITKQRWDSEAWAAQVKNYLENTCTEWLLKYVRSRFTLERRVFPEVDLFQKNSSSPVVCHATGFFPKAVMIYWRKNGEDLDEDVELRETLPNQDGTFQKRSVLTVSPEELDRNYFACIILHSSLEMEIELPVSERRILQDGSSSFRIIIIIFAAVLLLFALWMMMKDCSKETLESDISLYGETH